MLLYNERANFDHFGIWAINLRRVCFALWRVLVASFEREFIIAGISHRFHLTTAENENQVYTMFIEDIRIFKGSPIGYVRSSI